MTFYNIIKASMTNLTPLPKKKTTKKIIFMATTDCEIAGTKYRMDFEKRSEKGAITYYGTLLTTLPLVFTYTIFFDKKIQPLFTPLQIEPYRENAIIIALHHYEKNNNDGRFGD